MTKHQTEFMALYEPLHLRLSNYCRSMARNRADADDLLNDTILAAYEQFDKLENPDRFAGYLFAIASNLFKKQLRRKKFRGNYNEKEALLLEDLATDTESRVELSIVMQKMELLPALQREALILFHISDLPMEEIRNIQGGSLSAVKQRIKRGRERLMQLCTERQQLLITLFF
ncbi:MAG: RNA polymerase sigma factor [Prolixibacteraceae bacterium]|nr:RNA polymerase sigma factor [Prolixibacteraceae bacterium]